jgi:hypothetical protein
VAEEAGCRGRFGRASSDEDEGQLAKL